MRRLFIFIAPLCALALSAHCANDDEAKFKPQGYTPRKDSLNARTFSEKPYTVSEKAGSRPTGNPISPAQARQVEMKPLVTKEPLNSKSLEPPPSMQVDPYVRGDKQTYASTISPDKLATATERKPFVVTTNKLNTAKAPTKDFIPTEKSKEKNPMLQPRQGIKELPTDDNR